MTDRELALMATTSLVFPYAKHQLCICAKKIKSKVPLKKAKNKCGHSPNNGHSHSTEKKKNKVPLKKAKNNKMPHLNNVILDIHIHHDAVLEVHNPIGDENCSFQLLAVAIFKNKKC
ncbi:19772_t:CDS:2 [Gigaspora margarita]|uniref:19772_t:CDS:1 n=1 Tax=Gigaspora margarita TaxID=4874 RepID=A0ABN7VLF0_GIGMA|nr:19772_t:CDS:2 [Gigaspora margarita]